MKKNPDRLNINKDDLKDFTLLQEEKDSPLYKKDNKTVFLMAMVFGLSRGTRIPLKSKHGFVRDEYLNSNDRTLIKAIAIKEMNSLSVLAEPSTIYQIAEEYVTGGIEYLKKAVFDKHHGSFTQRFELELLEELNKYNASLNGTNVQTQVQEMVQSEVDVK